MKTRHKAVGGFYCAGVTNSFQLISDKNDILGSQRTTMSFLLIRRYRHAQLSQIENSFEHTTGEYKPRTKSRASLGSENRQARLF